MGKFGELKPEVQYFLANEYLYINKKGEEFAKFYDMEKSKHPKEWGYLTLNEKVLFFLQENYLIEFLKFVSEYKSD